MKVLIYTAIVNRYETLQNPDVIDPRIEYICFTDEPFLHKMINNTVWKIEGLPKSRLDPTRKARQVKILAHRALKGRKCTHSVWIDGNINIIGDVVKLVSKYADEKLVGFKHPSRGCIYEEAEECKNQGKDNPEVIDRQMAHYAALGYPREHGLTENNVIIRQHNHPEVESLMEAWWSEVERYSKRDQLSFGFAAWKLDFTSALMGEHNARGSSEVFRVRPGWRTTPKVGPIGVLWDRHVLAPWRRSEIRLSIKNVGRGLTRRLLRALGPRL